MKLELRKNRMVTSGFSFGSALRPWVYYKHPTAQVGKTGSSEVVFHSFFSYLSSDRCSSNNCSRRLWATSRKETPRAIRKEPSKVHRLQLRGGYFPQGGSKKARLCRHTHKQIPSNKAYCDFRNNRLARSPNPLLPSSLP